MLWPAALLWAGARESRGDEWSQRTGTMPPLAPGGIWVHAASVGEVAGVAPLVRALADVAGVVLTVVTPTGRESALRSVKEHADVLFAPLDLAPAVRKTLASLKPRLLILTETELWPNTIIQAAAAGVPVGVVNGRMSARSLRRYRMPGSPLAGLGESLSFVAARSSEDAGRFEALGVARGRIRVTGDLKYDKLERPLEQSERRALSASLGLPESAPVVVFGSVRPKEEPQVAHAAARLLGSFPELHVLAAPRHMDRVAELFKALREAGARPVVLVSEEEERRGNARAHVLDSTGTLAKAYSVGSVAFVGGTLAPYGGHDPLEPAAQGVPVVMGPHTESCREAAAALLAGGAARIVENGEGLARAVAGLLEDEVALARAGKAALDVVDAGRGAVDRTLDFLRSVGVLDGD